MVRNAVKGGSYIVHYIAGAILVGDNDDATQYYYELLQKHGVENASDGYIYFAN